MIYFFTETNKINYVPIIICAFPGQIIEFFECGVNGFSVVFRQLEVYDGGIYKLRIIYFNIFPKLREHRIIGNSQSLVLIGNVLLRFFKHVRRTAIEYGNVPYYFEFICVFHFCNFMLLCN